MAFSFGKAIFGRKGLTQPAGTPSPSFGASANPGAPEPWRPAAYANFDDLTVEGMYTRCAQMVRGRDRDPAFAIDDAISALSPAERGELLASLASDAETLSKYHGQSRTRDGWVSRCYRQCFQLETEVSKEHLPALLTFLVEDDSYRRNYYHKQFATLLRLINQAIKDGGFLTSADVEQLGAFGGTLRLVSEKESSKANKKTMLLRAEAVEKLAGVEVSATSLLLERCEGAENVYALGERPPHYAFWAEMFAATIAGLHAITDDLRDKGRPAWLKDRAAFAEAWPAVGPLAPRFGAWNEAAEEKFRNFPTLRAYGKRRTKGDQLFANPERVRALSQFREHLAPTLAWRWDTPQIPALDVLANLESPEWTEMLEHLISGKVAPRPTTAWRKHGLKLAQVIGTETVAARLQSWLALFHTPELTAETLADRTNVEEMDRTVVHLNERLPDWPSLIPPQDIAAAGHAVAMLVASQFDHGLPKPFSAQMMECTDHVWDNQRVSEGQLRIRAVSPKQSNGHDRYESPATWLKVSIENEALLRGAMWLAVELSPRDEAVKLLKAIALAGASRFHLGDQGHRSKVVANAAIATLIDLGGADVDAAVLSLSHSIHDRTINVALFRALNKQS